MSKSTTGVIIIHSMSCNWVEGFALVLSFHCIVIHPAMMGLFYLILFFFTETFAEATLVY